ncbi:hypothetical protein ACOMHN_008302 [Nucella lapillus]
MALRPGDLESVHYYLTNNRVPDTVAKTSGKKANFERLASKFTLINGKLHTCRSGKRGPGTSDPGEGKKLRVIIDIEERQRILRSVHEGGGVNFAPPKKLKHFGQDKTEIRLGKIVGGTGTVAIGDGSGDADDDLMLTAEEGEDVITEKGRGTLASMEDSVSDNDFGDLTVPVKDEEPAVENCGPSKKTKVGKHGLDGNMEGYAHSSWMENHQQYPVGPNLKVPGNRSPVGSPEASPFHLDGRI